MNTEVATTARFPQFLDDVENMMLNHSEMEPFLRPLHKSFYKVSQMAGVGRKARELFEAAKAEGRRQVEYCEEMQDCEEAVDQHQKIMQELDIKIQHLIDGIIEETYNAKIRTDAFVRVKKEILALLYLSKGKSETLAAFDKNVLHLEATHDMLLDELVKSQCELHRARIRFCDLTDKFQLVVAEKELDNWAEDFLNTEHQIDNPPQVVEGTPDLEALPAKSSDPHSIRFEDHPDDSGIEMLESPVAE